jgi:hypothetical protein
MLKRTSLSHALVTFVAATALVACSRSDIAPNPAGSGGGGAAPSSCQSDADCSTTPATPRCALPEGVCVECVTNAQCPADEVCHSHVCTTHCGAGSACEGSLDCCASLCVDPGTDPENCGGCGVACGPYDHALAACKAGECGVGKCAPGFADCDHVVGNGCEVATDIDPANCGGCGQACGFGETCSGGVCLGSCGGGVACTGAQSCCGSQCKDTENDPLNCGGCGVACQPAPQASVTCAGSACVLAVCAAGFADCNHVEPDGCEVDLGSDPKNCGGCGNTCAAGETCSAGVCVGGCGTSGSCTAGFTCCFGSICDNLQSDVTNCGGCGAACGPVQHGTAACHNAACAVGSCASGWADCNGAPFDGCETSTGSDPKNCGSCGHGCPAGASCVNGVCGGVSCGITGCPAGASCCGDACRDTSHDLQNCGGCGNACPAGANVCNNGACCFPDGTCEGQACANGLALCNNTCVDLGTDPNNCGNCQKVCLAGQSCVGGKCQGATCNGGPACTPGLSCCATGCANLLTDASNCGSCGGACPPGNICLSGQCQGTCNGGPACSASQQCCFDGCADITSSETNCGACGNVCKPGQTCLGGSCQTTCNGGPACGIGQSCCATGCADPLTDPKNCGSCGNVCATGSTCDKGTCKPPPSCNGGPACSAAQTCCATGCADTESDNNNCGACGTVCPATAPCTGGTCAASEGAFNPFVNPTYLSPGVHNFTTINVPAGVVVYVGGAGAASGTLELYATGTIVIDGTIDLSGGPGVQTIITSTSTQLGRAGGGGYTGEPYQSAPLSSSCAFIAGNAGSLGDAMAGSSGTCTVLSTTTCVSQTDPSSRLWTAPVAQFGGGAGVFTGYRSYGSGGGGRAGGAPGALGPPYAATGGYPAEDDCTGVSGGGGAVKGQGGQAGSALYNGIAGVLGQTQCQGVAAGIPPAYVGGGGGGSIGAAAAADLAVLTTFRTGSGGGGGSADYMNRPVFGGTSGGGGGGGALRLSTPASITIHGQLLTNGGPGGDAYIGNGSAAGCDPQPGAAGGGGSGGVIYLSAPSITVGAAATISAGGGAGGAQSVFATGGGGGGGGLGRIRISATQASCTLQGMFNPPLVSGCSATTPTAGKAYVGVYPN